jgi:hypothetical protein
MSQQESKPADREPETSGSPAAVGPEERSTTAGVPPGDVVIPGGNTPPVDPVTDAVLAEDWGRAPADDLDVDDPTLHPVEGRI